MSYISLRSPIYICYTFVNSIQIQILLQTVKPVMHPLVALNRLVHLGALAGLI